MTSNSNKISELTDHEQPGGVELLLEPTKFEPSKVYQKALFDAGIPHTVFSVDNIQKEHERLLNLA